MQSDVIKKKLEQGFTVDDLSDYVRERVNTTAKVYPLMADVWIEAGRYKIFLLDFRNDQFGSVIKVLVSKFKASAGGFVVSGNPVKVADLNLIPGTKLFFDVWFAGNGVDCVPLVVEEIEIEQTKLEDFGNVGTNLSLVERKRVAKAILEKRVEWDESKTNQVGEGCGGEFVFENRRYKYEEVMENPTGLYLMDE